MAQREWRYTHAVTTLVTVALALVLAGCGSTEPRKEARPDSPSASESGTSAKKELKDLAEPLLSSDLLVVSKETIADSVAKRIKALPGVTHVEPLALGQFFSEEEGVTYAAVDPDSFRRLTPPGTAQTLDVWNRVASGEMAINPKLGRELQDKDGYVRVGAGKDATRIHIGALADLTDPDVAPMTRIDAVVDEAWVKHLDMRRDNAMIVSMGQRSPQSILKKLRSVVGEDISVQILGPNLDPTVAQIAIPTGGSVARAIGAFSYTLRGRTVIPEAGWVNEYIRTETLPVVGQVRCHKVMLAQLRMVMLEIQRLGLSKAIYDYGGCYVPRYIAGKSTLSNHSFGTAIDLNVQDNLRGVPGKMDRRVVAIFKRFGFAWGGDWRWTDPMHFELARLVKQG